MHIDDADKRDMNQWLPTAPFGQVIFRSESGQVWVAHLECYPEEQLLRSRKAGAGTALLDALSPRELALARTFADGLRIVAIVHLQRAGLWLAPC